MIINSRLKISKSGGFGILEVLLAGVIIITMLGALVILGRTVLSNLTYTAQRAQATFFAQQGIEIVREIRDTNYIDGSNATQWNSLIWNDPKYDIPAFGSNYTIAYNSPRPILVPDVAGTNDTISTLDNNTYTRTIKFKQVTNMVVSGSTMDTNNVFTVTCTVTMPNNKTISIDELITNSHPNF